MISVREGRENIVFVFIFFLILSICALFLSKSGFLDKPNSILYSLTAFFSRPTYNLFSAVTSFGQDSKLRQENLDLSKKIVDEQKLIAENKSLHDQFQTSTPKSLDLLPANVVGAPRFLPGITAPEVFIIDVGKKDGVKLGSAIVLKDNLIGKITKISDSLSEVTLLTNSSSKFAAKTASGVLGIVKGESNEDIILDNVLLSDSLQKGDFVVTNGDLSMDSTGFPPNLIVGRISSVYKNPSDLFQRAKVESLVNFSKITQVFVVVNFK